LSKPHALCAPESNLESNEMKNMKIGFRLGLGFAAVLALMIGVAAIGLSSMAKIQAELDKVVNQNVYKMGLLQDMSESVHIISRVTRTLVILPIARYRTMTWIK